MGLTDTKALVEQVREKLHQVVGFDRAGSLVSHPYEQTYHVIANGCDDALAALSELEARLEVAERLVGRIQLKREAAERERDEMRAALTMATPWNRAYEAEARIAELEEALEAAEALLAAEGLYEAEGGRQHEVDALRQALTALGDWPRPGYERSMFGGTA